MKRFAFLFLLNNSNMVMNEYYGITKADAVEHFQSKHPELTLDEDGYCKVGQVTWCVAEYFRH